MAYDPQQWIAEQLEGVFQAMPREGAERAVRAIERHGDGFGILAARSWAWVLSAIPPGAWTAEQGARLALLSSDFDEDELVAAVAFVGQAFDPAARAPLLDLVRADRIWALNYINDLGALASDIADELRSICMARVDKDRAAERDHTLSRGWARPLDGLVALTLAHPSDAAWEAVQRAIVDPVMPAWYKKSANARLATGRESIDRPLRASLAVAVRAAGKAPPSDRWRADDADLTGEVVYASIVLDKSTDQAPSEIGRLAGGEVWHRRLAARLANDVGDIAPLIVLATDQNPLVRMEAGYGLAQAACGDACDPRVLTALHRVIADRGRATGLAIAEVIADATHTAAFADLSGLLANHPSAEVRRLVREGR